jgi:formylglycine-generating enzyme required for sulfatase activity
MQGSVLTRSPVLDDHIIDGRYQLIKRLGRGSMGLVYQARHLLLKSFHAVKIILPDSAGHDDSLPVRFRQEAVAAAAIRHPNIIAVTDYGFINEATPFLVMDLVEGRSLRDMLEEEGRLSPERALQFMTPIVAGVAAAHRKGIIHRDLKPLNIMVSDHLPLHEGIKVLDFGLAKIRSHDLLGSMISIQTRGAVGSPYYMPPEQWSENQSPDARSDIYSLGIMLYQMLAGELPFPGGSLPELMKQHLMQPPPEEPLSHLPANLKAVVLQALAKEPENRFASAEAFIKAFRDALTAPSARPARRRASGLVPDTVAINLDTLNAAPPPVNPEDYERTIIEAREEAEAARLLAEEAARQRAEAETQRLAAEEAARQQTELIARQQAEAKAQRAAAEDARRRAEEAARLQAEAEARRQAAEEARRQAEEAARRMAEEEAARRRAEEELRQRALEEELRQRAEELARQEAEAAAQREAAEAAQRAEEEALRAAEEAARLQAEALNRQLMAETVRLRAEEAAREREATIARLQAEAETEQQAAEEAARAHAAAQAEITEAARLQAEAEARRQAAEETRRQAEESARRRALEAARLKAEIEAQQHSITGAQTPLAETMMGLPAAPPAQEVVTEKPPAESVPVKSDATQRRADAVTLTDSAPPAEDSTPAPPAEEAKPALGSSLFKAWRPGETARPGPAWIKLLPLAIVPLALLLAGVFVLQRACSVTPGPAPPPSASAPAKPPAGMVLINGGAFEMGRNDVAREANEYPAHQVTLTPFFLDETEVTNAEYAKFVQATGYPAPANPPAKDEPLWRAWSGPQPPAGQEQWPVRNVTVADAEAFARWRSQRDGFVCRLPTEEEWEFAARDGKPENLYPWGNKFSEGQANMKKFDPANPKNQPEAVRSFAADRTAAGVFDLAGNVYEWTSSKAKYYEGNGKTLPPAEQNLPVIRGGAYSVTQELNAASRQWAAQITKHPTVGFRLACEVKNEQAAPKN